MEKESTIPINEQQKDNVNHIEKQAISDNILHFLEKIYNNFTYKGEGIQDIDKQFFMHPYAGLRFEFKMTTRELCQRYIKP